MSLINDFILENQHVMTDKQMADALGMYKNSVSARKKILAKSKSKPVNKDVFHAPDELLSLLNFIEVRQTGWAVEVAKERIEKLRKIRSMSL